MAIHETPGVEEDAHPTTAGRPRGFAVTRRQFVIGAAAVGAAGAGLVVGVTLYERQRAARGPDGFSPNAWMRIAPDDTVTITVGKSEMGQGVLTALAMMAAEELDADWSRVRAEQAPAGAQFGDQLTDGSTSVMQSFAAMRSAGAQARALLVAAAANDWGVDAAACRTEQGAVLHPPSGRRLSYGRLARAAAALGASAPVAITLKGEDRLALIGTPAPRLDVPAKVDGSARYGLDVRLPGMRFATVARCPVPGGGVKSFDATRAKAVPGVRAVAQVPSGVAVLADHTWAAIVGRRALDVTWGEGENATLDSASLRAQFAAAAAGLPHRTDGSQAGVTRRVVATYELPYLAHAPMEPLNCTAVVRGGRCEVWAGTQDPQGALAVAALASGLPADAVTVHVPLLGGGFGRRTFPDFVAEAVHVAKAAGAPVQVVWTREDDIQHDYYRPATAHRLTAGLDAAGRLVFWWHALAGQSMGHAMNIGAANLPYALPAADVRTAEITTGVPTGIWRGVDYTHNTFAVECFLDEIAAAGHLDPLELRLGLLGDTPRLQAVLRLAAEKAGWDGAPAAGVGRGIAACAYRINNGYTYTAQVAEASVGSDGAVRVHRVVCAVDCGLVVNPRIAEAQVEGGVLFGLTAALKGEITFAGGRAQQSNFHDYPLLRMDEAPAVEVHFVPSREAPSGLGEPGVPPAAPALANAIFAATGRRVRRLPIRPADLR